MPPSLSWIFMYIRETQTNNGAVVAADNLKLIHTTHIAEMHACVCMCVGCRESHLTCSHIINGFFFHISKFGIFFLILFLYTSTPIIFVRVYFCHCSQQFWLHHRCNYLSILYFFFNTNMVITGCVSRVCVTRKHEHLFFSFGDLQESGNKFHCKT